MGFPAVFLEFLTRTFSEMRGVIGSLSVLSCPCGGFDLLIASQAIQAQDDRIRSGTFLHHYEALHPLSA